MDGNRILPQGAKSGAEACIGATDYLVLASTASQESALLLVPCNVSGLKEK